jgi:hypothetical protein
MSDYDILSAVRAKLAQSEEREDDARDCIDALLRRLAELEDQVKQLTEQQSNRQSLLVAHLARMLAVAWDDFQVSARDAGRILGRTRAEVACLFAGRIQTRRGADGEPCTSLAALADYFHGLNVAQYKRAGRHTRTDARLRAFADRQAKFDRRALARLAAILARPSLARRSPRGS